MARSMLDLFKTKQISDDGTAQEKYAVRNSKDIRVSSSYPLLNPSFSILRRIRSTSALTNRKSETFLEQELTGLRPLRVLSAPIIYGTDSIRLINRSTPDVEAMKAWQTGGDAAPTTKFGKAIKNVRDTVNSKLGIPTSLYPTSYADGLVSANAPAQGISTPAVFDRMIRLNEIANGRGGSFIGNLLKNTGRGTPQQIATRTLGAGLGIGKEKVRQILLGAPVGEETNLAGRSAEKYKQYSFGKDSYTSLPQTPLLINNAIRFFPIPTLPLGKASSQFDFQSSKLRKVYKESGVSPVTGLNRVGGIYGQGDYTLVLPPGITLIQNFNPYGEQDWRFRFSIKTLQSEKGVISVQDLIARYSTYEDPYSKTTNDTYAPGEASDKFDTQAIGNTSVKQSRKLLKSKLEGQDQSLLNNIRPPAIPKDKLLSSAVKTEKSLTDYGFNSKYDTINELGVLTQKELEDNKDIDLIPFKLQRMSDRRGIYVRAGFGSFNESFKPTWDSSRMLGSPFNVYNYSSIERTLSFDLKFYAMSPKELKAMWERIEFIAKFNYPASYASGSSDDTSADGIATPNLLWLTIGNLYINQPCILTSLTHTIDDTESIWEIGGQYEKERTAVKYYDSRIQSSLSVGETSGTAGTYWNEMKKEYTAPRDSDVKERNLTKYKVPKVIGASLAFTLLESVNSTRKLYRTG